MFEKITPETYEKMNEEFEEDYPKITIKVPTQEQIDFDSLKKSMVFGTVAASYCVENFGVKGVQDLDFSQIEKRLEIFKPYLL